jgi:four helix bundle protein
VAERRTIIVNSYKDLTVWQAAVNLAVLCYDKTRPFPNSETYGMVAQIRRAATSVAANIAEGHGRQNTGSFVQFLRIAQGSLKELETHIAISTRVGLLDEASAGTINLRCEEVGKMLRSLIQSLQQRQ